MCLKGRILLLMIEIPSSLAVKSPRRGAKATQPGGIRIEDLMLGARAWGGPQNRTWMQVIHRAPAIYGYICIYIYTWIYIYIHIHLYIYIYGYQTFFLVTFRTGPIVLLPQDVVFSAFWQG
jgi:hypothetical protein